jgi:ubiquinone/menaquinone biosynthesis C-methylase UbiE
MLRRVSEKVESLGLSNVEVREGAVESLDLGKGLYDRALLVTVLGEIPDQEAALGAVYEALKPGGLCTVTEVIFDPHFQTQSAVRKLARAVGFGDVKVFGNRIAYTMTLTKPPV